VWDAVERNWRTAPIGPKLHATLGFLERMTLNPDELDRGDAARVRQAGVSDAALVDAIHVCALFNMIVRLADALGWDVPQPEVFAVRAEMMLADGYALPTAEQMAAHAGT